ncbi:acetyl-CoA hydrolase/transferase C-terminal domain-containing protein [Streptomyces canus]|uniref:acetyl-CoA hydrolase/transferase family protein n=1 Tax=Streptomyces canus TaxID=58343 RepID=UPI0036E78711
MAPTDSGSGDRLDLARHIRAHDMVVWGQASAEPRTLTELLLAQRGRIGPLRCFVGIPAESALTLETSDGLDVHSYCGSGTNAALQAAGRLDVVPVHYSTLPRMLSAGPLRADVVLVQVSPPDERGRHSLGLADDYFSAALDTARVVIAEINDQVPYTYGARTIGADEWTAAIHTSRTPGRMPAGRITEQIRAAAKQVAGLIQDGATLQFGIGALPDAVLTELHDRRDLGIHSGILNDSAMRLIEDGVVTGERKTIDRGVAVAGLLAGSERLFRFAHRNPRLLLRNTAYTHAPEVLAASHQLVAVNSAIEVDLTGQVNAETAAGRYVGAVGGAVDFLRGASRSPGGLPIVALPSTAAGRSRIVARLSGPTSTPRSEPLIVVTEHGVADLRGLPVSARIERMLAVADPAHRADLEAAAAPPLAA